MPALVAKLRKVETTTVGHPRHWGFMDWGMKRRRWSSTP
jgi:hypothetical protein